MGEGIAHDNPESILTQPEIHQQVVAVMKPLLIINVAAYHNTNMAESEPELARAIYALSDGILAREVKNLIFVFLHYSNDKVFDGTKGSPYIGG